MTDKECMMRLLGVVVLYNPADDVWANMLTYLPFLDKLIIWDNTPKSLLTNDGCREKLGCEDVLLLSENRNVGIGKALNEAAKYAMENAYTHLLTMDQDSSFPDGMFSKYKDCVAKRPDIKDLAYCIGGGESSFYTENDVYSTVTGFITSGTIFPVLAFQKLGLFREDFFVDAIDCEFACRIRKAGYSITQVNPVRMNHQLGYPLSYKLWGKERVTLNYPAARTYYVTRNYFLLYRLYNHKEYEGYIWFLKVYCFWRPIGIIMKETDKKRKLKAFLMGLFHGIIGRSGEYTL